MWKGSYGKEPFDLRLTALRFMRNFVNIIVLTMIGTLLFGGGYYVKNVLLIEQREYSATSTFKVDYTEPPVNAGDYYINGATWNTLMQTTEFLEAVEKHLSEIKIYGEDGTEAEMLAVGREEIAAAIAVELPSDWNIPVVTIITDDPIKSLWISLAVEKTMENEFTEYMEEIRSVRVMSSANAAEEVEPDVRPLRAFVLSAVLSFFFIVVIFLLKEIGDDSIWLPATIRRRYGLKVLGTINSPEFQENIGYLFADKKKIGVCPVDDGIDMDEVMEALSEKAEKNWMSVPVPMNTPESCRMLREAEAGLLVVPAGKYAGKHLEYTMEYLVQQECEITAVMLWNADEWLIRAYYGFKKSRG